MTGSRTIRTEEAILISLAALEDKMEPKHRPKVFDLAHSIPQSADTGLKQSAEIHGSSKRKHKKLKEHHQNYVQSNNGADELAGGGGDGGGTEEDE